MAVLTVIFLVYSSHYIYGSKLGIRQDHEKTVTPLKAMNATAPDQNDTVRFPDYDLMTSINDKEATNENVTVGIEGSTEKNNGDNDGQLELNWDGNTQNATWFGITCNPSCSDIDNQTKGYDNEINSSPTGNSIERPSAEDILVDDFVNAGHGESVQRDKEHPTTIPNPKNSVDIQSFTTGQSGPMGWTVIGSGNTVNNQDNAAGDSEHIERRTTVNGITDNSTDNSIQYGRTTVENDFVNKQLNATDDSELSEQQTAEIGNFIDIQDTATIDSGLFERTTTVDGISADIRDKTSDDSGLLERTIIGNDNIQDNVTGDCVVSASQPSNGTFLPPLNDMAEDNFNCVFASQGYVNFYRLWIWFDALSLFVIPVVILIVSNTATWVKVYKMAHGPLINPTSQTIRRTRHVIILTTLISISFILFVSPFTILFVLESETDDDLQYPMFTNDSRAVLKLIAECLYLCNPTCNFFLYIISGRRFRNSFKAVFCKPKPQTMAIAQKPLEMLPSGKAMLETAGGQNAQNE